MIDDRQYDRLLAAARTDLAFMTDAAGRIQFTMQGLVATGYRSPTVLSSDALRH